MNGSEIDWQQIAIWVGGGSGAAIAAAWAAFRKPKDNEAGNIPRGTSQVVAASFVDKEALEKMTSAMLVLTGHVVTLCQHMATAEQFRHDERIAKDAAAHALLEARLGNRP